MALRVDRRKVFTKFDDRADDGVSMESAEKRRTCVNLCKFYADDLGVLLREKFDSASG